MIPPATLAGILAVSKLDKNLLPTDASDSYRRGARRRQQDGGAGRWRCGVPGSDRRSARSHRLVQNAASGTPTKNARDALEELPRNDIKAGLAAAQRRQALVRGQLPQLRQAGGRHLLGLVRPALVAALKGRCVRS